LKILGIETSCDETAASVVDDGRRLLSNIVSSQIDLHAKTGGVVPEVASRKHVEQIAYVVDEAVDAAGITLGDIDGFAVSNRPGLLGALLVGVSAAKALAYARQKPLMAVHHIEAHLYANWLVDPGIAFPVVALVVSGGHTQIFRMTGHGEYAILGQTRDDAAGEAFDKCARLLGFPYPGGASIDRLAKTGDRARIALPRAWLGDSLDFSFSGLKTAVAQAVRSGKHEGVSVDDWAASIQEAIVDVLVTKTMRAAVAEGVGRVLLSGGVAANSRLQSAMASSCEERGLQLTAPPPVLCTDNAAMIACAGYYHWQTGKTDGLDLDTIASEALA
jgi:N6-L-threonylcarbamoyladenine synthase